MESKYFTSSQPCQPDNEPCPGSLSGGAAFGLACFLLIPTVIVVWFVMSKIGLLKPQNIGKVQRFTNGVVAGFVASKLIDKK